MFGTCAGLIMLDREHLGIMDIVARRNAFGRQVHSFEEELQLPRPRGRAGPRRVHPRAVDRGARARASRSSRASTAIPSPRAQGGLTVIAFHPELGADTRLHERFLEQVRAR